MNNLVNCQDCNFKDKDSNKCIKHDTRIYKNLNNPEYSDNYYYPCYICNGKDFERKLEIDKGELSMKFELGKYYQHTTGHKLYICGIAQTYYHGRCFVGENEYGELSPIGSTQENAVNYHEISREEFIGEEIK